MQRETDFYVSWRRQRTRIIYKEKAVLYYLYSSLFGCCVHTSTNLLVSPLSQRSASPTGDWRNPQSLSVAEEGDISTQSLFLSKPLGASSKQIGMGAPQGAPNEGPSPFYFRGLLCDKNLCLKAPRRALPGLTLDCWKR